MGRTTNVEEAGNTLETRKMPKGSPGGNFGRPELETATIGDPGAGGV